MTGLEPMRLQKCCAAQGAGLNISDAPMRDGRSQRFEFADALSPKRLKRYLESAAAGPTECDLADFQCLIRAGHRQGLC